MRMYDIISKKRDGAALSSEEIRYFIREYTKGNIPDYQASALLMAIYINGMSDEETTDLTYEMSRSGDVVDLTAFGNLSVDKHSTGGVGDKTTLITAPIVAACGCKVTKMSGRGLGFTGGTADKLKAIPNYRTNLTNDEFFSIAQKTGIAIVTQSGNLTPADKKLYALRDVTATVDCIPLIASSVMSKKIAAGAYNIVLDVKYGSGAFMKTKEDAERLAGKMVEIGKMCGRKTSALVTDMNTPLGFAVGNILEVVEAVNVLKGKIKGDIREVSVALAGNMISLVHNISAQEGIRIANDALDSKKAFLKMREWISAQGGDVSYIDNTDLFPKAEFSMEVKSNASGYITQMDAEKIGNASMILGAGRISKEDEIDFCAGVSIRVKTGEYVGIGDTLATLYTNKKETLNKSAQIYKSAISISTSKPVKNDLIYKTIVC